MSEIRKQSIECPVRHGQPVGRQNVQELLGRELPEDADDFDCFDESDEDRTSLRLGPQHPATHGVLRLDLELEGETILSCDPQVGYLHRGFEKMAETFTYAQALTLTDRLDYIAAMSNNTGYCLAVEKLLGVQTPLRARYIRTIACEMSRLCSHLLWLATHALDIGAMTVFLYCFREREMLLDLFEDLCGARLTLTYPRIGGVRQDVTGRFMDGLQDFLNIFPKRILEYETLLDTNRIWLQRTVGVGVLNGKEALALGLTGACAARAWITMCASTNPTMPMIWWILKCRWAAMAIFTPATAAAWKKCASLCAFCNSAWISSPPARPSRQTPPTCSCPTWRGAARLKQRFLAAACGRSCTTTISTCPAMCT